MSRDGILLGYEVGTGEPVTFADPGVLQLLQQRPEIVVTFNRPVINADGGTLYGRLAGMIVDGFFDTPRNGNQAFEDLKRRGKSTATPNVYRECDKLAEQGFLTKEASGYQAVADTKKDIRKTRG